MSTKATYSTHDPRYLPFINFSVAEFNAKIGNWQYDFDTDLHLFNIPPNPDKSDNRDPDNMLNCPRSNCYSLTQLSQLFIIPLQSVSLCFIVISEVFQKIYRY